MPVLSNQQVTLNAGQTTLLHNSRREKCKVTLTAISGEFATIPFQTVKFGALKSSLFEASTVKLSFLQCFPSGKVLATTPAGVATLDVEFEVRTGADA
jgi:glutamate synthase domain-containing protein 2